LVLYLNGIAIGVLELKNKLLTGFDAPPCTYLYIDKSMQDHGLFQAICRVNRLDGEDKRALYNNLNQNEELALRLDEIVKKTRPDGWRGVQAREQVIKRSLYEVLRSEGQG
jgi:type I site-specific restriction-modification system R (restriction) subunit